MRTDGKNVGKRDARTVLQADVAPPVLEETIAIASIFGIVMLYADALCFAIPTVVEFDKAADMLFKRGYA